MKTIIMGCGRVGSGLARRLDQAGREVCVIDRDPESRHLLTAAFSGRFLVGNGYSRALLETAGLAVAEAFVAVTSGDNTNIVGARIAKEDYRVPHVIARIYDPGRADIYRDLGIPTVASVRWTVTRIQQMLEHRYLNPEVTFGNGETLLVQEVLPDWFTGRRLDDLDLDGLVRPVVVTRAGRAFLPTHDSLAQQGDEVTFAVAATALGQLRSFLDRDLGS